MSIRFKFRSSVNFDTVDIEGRSSISIAELRSMIIRQKKLNLCQDFDLVFSDAVSGQVLGDHSTRIPSGSSVIIKRVPAEKAPSALRPIDVNGNHCVKDSHPFNPVKNQTAGFDDFDGALCCVRQGLLPDHAPEFNKEICGRSEEADVASPRIEDPMSRSTDPNQDFPRGLNAGEDNEKIEEHMKLEKLNASDYAPKEINGLPSELKCSLCNTYFKEAMMIPCCQHSFCNKCIRLVLVEKTRCPKCSSNKCKVEDLLPNLSLRQAIKHFLSSQIPSDSPEIDLSKYVPDGESGIQAEDVSCAETSFWRAPELPHSPSVTGRGSNQVMEEPFGSSFIRRNALSGASCCQMSDGKVIATPTMQKGKDFPGGKIVHTHQTPVQNGPKDSGLTADCQGENTSYNTVQPHVDDEAYSTSKRKRGMWVETEGREGNSIPAVRKNKATRTCYLCGSPGHLIRDCPAGSSPHPMLQSGPGVLQGGFPGYASSYWNGAPFPPPRLFPNISGNPGMMPFSATTIPVTHYRAPPYIPSVYGAFAPSHGAMRMGLMDPFAGIRDKRPLCHPQYLEPVRCEKLRRKLSDVNPHRAPNHGEEDVTNEHYRYLEPERPLEHKVPKAGEASVSCSGDSFARRTHNHQHAKHIESDAYSVDSRREKRPHLSIGGHDQKPYHERADSGMLHMSNSNNKNGDISCKHHKSSSRKHCEKREETHIDSSHGNRHQSDRDCVRWRVESSARSYHKQQSSYPEFGLKQSFSVDKRKPKGVDSGSEYRHPGQSAKRTGEDLQAAEWHLVGGSDKDYKGDYCHQKRKRNH